MINPHLNYVQLSDIMLEEKLWIPCPFIFSLAWHEEMYSAYVDTMPL
jgi:hypothetical protein